MILSQAGGFIPVHSRSVAPEDDKFVANEQPKEREQLGELLTQHMPAIFNLIYRFTRDRMEAENLTQDTLLRAWNARGRIDLTRPLKPLLLQIAINVCRSWYAARKGRAQWMNKLDQDDAEWLADERDDLLEHIAEAELVERLYRAIDDLTPAHRIVVTLYYTEELSYEEIAQLLDLPVNTVRTQLHRAKARLREQLNETWTDT